MIRHARGATDTNLTEVDSQLLQAAAERPGEWEIVTWEYPRVPQGLNCYERPKAVRVTARFSEAELARLLHYETHTQRNETKTTNADAGLEQLAVSLWDKGSLDHVAMRHVAVPLVSRYITAQRTCEHLWFWDACAASLADISCGFITWSEKSMKTTLHRVPTETSVGPAEAAPPGPGEGNDVTVPKPLPQVAVTPVAPAIHGGHTDRDAEVIAGMGTEGRFVKKQIGSMQFCGVAGKDFNDKDPDFGKIVGVAIGPTAREPTVYHPSTSNVKSAVDERITKKQVKPTPTQADKDDLDAFVKAITSDNDKSLGCFSSKRIEQAILHLTADLSGEKSKKWTATRLAKTMDRCFADVYPRISSKVNIKAEPLAPGKPPRFLLADGDPGQLFSLLAIVVFEHCMFEWFDASHVKHMGKQEAVFKILANLKGGRKDLDGNLVEGDGSAWDTTCSEFVRRCENAVIRKISKILSKFLIVPDAWLKAHMDINEKEKLKTFFDGLPEKIRLTIDNIRRSGARGTSSLNWFTNHAYWCVAIFGSQAWKFANPKTVSATDRCGIERRWRFAYEGDDSLCRIAPPMQQGSKLAEEFEAFWTRCGFRMKLVMTGPQANGSVKQVAEFCGWKIATTPTGAPIFCQVAGEEVPYASPDLARGLTNMGITVSSEAVTAFRTGDAKTIMRVGASKILSKAYEFSGHFPTVSTKCLQYAQSLKALQPNTELDRELQMVAQGDVAKPLRYSEVLDLIEQRNSTMTPAEEQKRMEALGYPASGVELDGFRLRPWDLAGVDDMDGFLQSLPASWRP